MPSEFDTNTSQVKPAQAQVGIDDMSASEANEAQNVDSQTASSETSSQGLEQQGEVEGSFDKSSAGKDAVKDGAKEVVKNVDTNDVSSKLKSKAGETGAETATEAPAAASSASGGTSSASAAGGSTAASTAGSSGGGIGGALANLGQAGMGLVSKGFSAIGGAISNGAHAVGGILHSMWTFGTTAVSNFLGFFGFSASATATSTITGTMLTTMIVTVTTALSMALGNMNTAALDTLVNRCGTVVQNQSIDANGETFVNDQIVEQNAMKVYSVLHKLGLADENIAGLLGNWSAESGIDPTTVEAIYGESYRIGPRKQQAIAHDLSCDYIFIEGGTLSDWYRRQGWAVPEKAGIGLGGWTAGNATALTDFAKRINREWYLLDTQIAFTIADASKGGYSSALGNLKDWAPESSPAEAALNFARLWEGNTVLAQDVRVDKAKMWFLKFAEWRRTGGYDAVYGQSILDLAQTVSINAAADAAGKSADECDEVMPVGDNSTAAAAAVAFAWPTTADGVGNHGTELYQKVIEAVADVDPLYESCDECVATAIRWSGTDDHFPMHGCSVLHDYMSTSPKWEKVNWHGDVTKLQPGDVLIIYAEHTFIYTGHDEILKKYPSSPANYMFVSASYMERSPGCQAWYDAYDGQPGCGDYDVFRCVQPETNSIYKNVLGGVNSTNPEPEGPQPPVIPEGPLVSITIFPEAWTKFF